MSDLVLLSEAQMRRIEAYFPLSHGIPRVDDRRIISGIILRSIEQLREGRGYISALRARRTASFARRVGKASNDAEVLAPWLSAEAA